MVDGERIREFRERWNYQSNPTQEFKRFRTRMDEVANSIWDDYFAESEDTRKRFAIVSGTACTEYKSYPHGGLCKALRAAETEVEVAEVIHFLMLTMERRTNENVVADCCRRLQDALDLSPGVMIQLVRNGKTVMLYPTGVRMLDEVLVENNLAWLRRYPKAAKPFEEALKIYMAKDPNQYRNMLDNLRVALEQMLQAVLNNQKTLENQKQEFLAWLKKQGAHSQIGNMYHELLFGYFTRYQNDAVKHHEDTYTSAEIEFILYATGTLLRLIQRLVEQEPVTKATTARS
jgi:hypothetical protein